jgi:hypothetical protein
LSPKKLFGRRKMPSWIILVSNLVAKVCIEGFVVVYGAGNGAQDLAHADKCSSTELHPSLCEGVATSDCTFQSISFDVGS